MAPNQSKSEKKSSEKTETVECPACRALREKNDEPIKELSLAEQCQELAHLDGTWFLPDIPRSTPKSVYAACQLCRTRHNEETVIKGSIAILSNFKTHLKRRHEADVEGFESYYLAKKQKLDKKEQTSRRTFCNFSQKQMDENIVNLINSTFLPYEIVEDPAFRKIFDDLGIKQGGKTFQHMSTRTLVRKMEKSYHDVMMEIKQRISGVKYVCTSADVWTSRHRRFMGVTATWLDPVTLKRVTYAIACQRFPGSHTHDKIAKILNDIHCKFDLTGDKLTATVTDNASNFLKAFREFGLQPTAIDTSEDETENNEGLEGSIGDDFVRVLPFSKIVSNLLPEHRRCNAHLYNLLATVDTLKGIDSIESIKLMYYDIIKKCNQLWALLRSPKKYEIIHELLGEALKRPVTTRWNSLFDALQQLVKLKDKLKNVSVELELSNSFTPSDFKFLEEYVKCNEPIAAALDKLQGEDDVTYGYLLPTVISTRNQLQKLNEIPLEYCKELIPVLITSLEKRFKNCFDVVDEGVAAATAAAVHPRFRLRWLHCLEENARGNVMKAIKTGMAECYQPPPQASVEEPMDISCDGFDFDDGSQNAVALQNSFGTNTLEEEFKNFCDDKKNDMSILHAYPIVKATFIKFNTVLPSSASVERMFNLATMWNTPRFNRLSSEHFEQRVLGKANSMKN